MKKKKAALEADRKAKEKEAADKAPAGKGKKDAKKGKKKWYQWFNTSKNHKPFVKSSSFFI